MSHEQFGILAFCIVTASILPYVWRILTGRADTSITGWAIGTATGVITFLTYREFEATGANLWIAYIEMVDPALVLIAAIARRNKWEPLIPLEKLALAASAIALTTHVVAQNEGAKQLAYAAAIVADICAAIPVVQFAREKPWLEQPLAWLVSIVGVMVSFLAIEVWTPDQWSLPAYQLLFCLLMFIPTMRYRRKHRIPLRQWM